jgi:hypothetical protein
MNLRLWLSSFLLLIASAIAFGDDFDRHVADVVILQIKPVQKELGITDTQRAKMNRAADEHRAELAAYEKQLEASKGKPESSRLLSYFKQLRDSVLNDLSATQIRRLRELTLQHIGLVGLADQVVAKRVGLSDSQLKTVRQDIVRGQNAVKALSEATEKPLAAKYRSMKATSQADHAKLVQQFNQQLESVLRPKIAAMEQKDKVQILAILTAKQRAIWKSLQGKPYNRSNG